MKQIMGMILLALTLIAPGCARETRHNTASVASGEASPLATLCSSFDYSDTVALHDNEIMEKRVSEIVTLLPYTDSVTTRKALTKLFKRIKRDHLVLENTTGLFNHYLNNPSSPVRDETLYIRVLHSLLAVDSLPEAVKLRALNHLQTASLNRPGTIAADFEFEDRNGTLHTLHHTAANEILMIFYDPECPNCSDILRNIAADEAVNSMISQNALTVIAVYAEGKRDVWDSSKWKMPLNWIVGYDLTGILAKELYDLPAMPVAYLLDARKQVILKDPDPNLLTNVIIPQLMAAKH